MDEKMIIEAVQRGETETFGLLISRYQPLILSLIINLIGVEYEEQAKDIMQESFVKAFLAIDRFRFQSSFATWIYRITYNETMLYLRRRKRNTWVRDNALLDFPSDDGYETEESTPLKSISAEKLHRALQQLKESDRALLIFYYQENMSIQDIAYISKLSASNVKVKLFRLRKKLLKLLQYE